MSFELENKIYAPDIIKTSITPIIYNQTIVLANYEFKKYLGDVRKFTFKARDGTIKISFSQGQSNLQYVKLIDGQSWSEDLIRTANLMLYFQSDTVNAVLEIIVWQ